MSDSNGSSPGRDAEAADGLYARFMSLVPEIDGELAVLSHRRAAIDAEFRVRRDDLNKEHQAAVAELDVDRKRLTGILRSLGQSPPAPSKRRKGSATNGVGIKSDVLLALVKTIERQGESTFTILDIHERSGIEIGESATYSGISYLRFIEYVGKAGQDGKRTLWRVLDPEVGARLKKELEGGGQTPPAMPSLPFLQRTIEAIRSLDKPQFTVLEVNEALGLASPKQAYATFRFLSSISYVKANGTEPPGGGRGARAVYEIADETALNDLLPADATA